MIYIIAGCLSFLVIHIADIVSLKRVPWVKPVIWTAGGLLFIYAVVMLYIQPGTLHLPGWAHWPGWALFSASLVLFIYSLFINLPFRKTYITRGFGDRLVRDGMYSLVRHPGVIFLSLVLISTVLISGSHLLIMATPVFILLDTVLVTIQDRFFFGKMFSDYTSYREATPMLLPNRRSINAFINSIKQAGTQPADR